MTQGTIWPCYFCGQPSCMDLEIEKGRARRDSKDRVVNTMSKTVRACSDCHAGILARRAEELAAKYDRMAGPGPGEQLTL